MVRVDAEPIGGVMGHDLALWRVRSGGGGREQDIINDSCAIAPHKCGSSHKWGCVWRRALGNYTDTMDSAKFKQGQPGRVRGTEGHVRGQILQVCRDGRVRRRRYVCIPVAQETHCTRLGREVCKSCGDLLVNGLE
jgi:hypothetical protein